MSVFNPGDLSEFSDSVRTSDNGLEFVEVCAGYLQTEFALAADVGGIGGLTLGGHQTGQFTRWLAFNVYYVRTSCSGLGLIIKSMFL